MFEISVTKDMEANARRKADEMGVLYNSILRGRGNFAGFVGEFAAAAALDAEVHNTKDYDLTKDGLTIDVKTKQSDYVPKASYEASVADYNPNQKCDYYLFTRASWKRGTVFILGLYRQADYVRDATFYKRGDIDPNNKFLVRADMHNMRHDALIGWGCETPEQLREVWQELVAVPA